MTVKLLDKDSKDLVDFEPGAVNAAVQSGRFLFPKDRGVPVRVEGKEAYVTPQYAAKYRDRLLFVNDEDVERARAEERFKGIGGAAQALGYGAVKGLSLGAVPALAASISPEAAEYSRQIELGRPTLTTAGEVGGLLVDPFAAAGKALKLGARGAQEAGLAARTAEAGAQRAAVSPAAESLAGTVAARAPVQVAEEAAAQPAVGLGAQMAMAPEVSPLALGRQAAAPTAEEAAQLGFRARARQGLVTRPPVPTEPMFPVAPGAAATAEPGMRLGADIYRTPELALRARQAEELTARAQAARTAQGRVAEEAVAMERGLQPGQVGPIEDFTRPPSEFLHAGDVRNELANLDESLRANAAAARRARSEASRERFAAERDRLLAQRDELEYRLFGAETRAEEAMTTQAERALGAAEMQAGAPARAAEAGRMGRMAGELEAANVIPPTLGRAATRMEGVGAEGMRPLGEAGTMPRELPGLRLGAPAAEEAAALPAAAEAAMPMPTAGAPVAQGRGFAIPADMASMAAQGGLYGASEEARRQATGESEGGLGAVLGAGAIGAALPAGMMLGGKALAKGAGKAAELGAGALPTSERLAKVAGGIEDAHLMRMFGISPKQIERLNAQFSEIGAGKKGTSTFSDFIKSSVSDLEGLKKYAPENQILQTIPTDKPLKFGQLTPERRTAIAEAVKAKLGTMYDELLTPEILSQEVTANELRSILSNVEKTAVKGIGESQFKTIRPELNGLRRTVDAGQSMTVGELRQMRKTLDDIFSARNGGFDKPFTSQQSTLRGAVDDLIFGKIDAVAPGTSDAIRAVNREYTMAGIMERGARSAETKAATTSPIGRDLLTQTALGFAIGNPIGASLFFVGSATMRGIYNARGDGIIADLAGRAERAMLRIPQEPAVAAQQAARAIVDTKRPMLLGASAAALTAATPQDYTTMSKAVRDLQASREKTMNEVQRAVSNLPPDQQQKAIQNFDTVVNALASELPKGLALEKSLSEQERRYMVFARSVLDPAYGTQVLVNGGPDSSEAAKAFASLGPAGQEYLTKLADNLRDQINESEKLRGDPQYVQAYRNIKSKASVSIGGGRGGRAAVLHTVGKPGAPSLKAPPMVSPATSKALVGSLTGMGPGR